MKALALCLVLIWNVLFPAHGIAQEREPRFTHHLAATSLGNLAGIVLTAVALKGAGVLKDGELDGLLWLLGVGPVVGCNLGVLTVSRERSRIFRSNLFFSALPLVLLLKKSTGPYGVLLAGAVLPIYVMFNSFYIDLQVWREAQSLQSVPRGEAWLVPVSPVELVRFVAKVPLIQVSW